MVRYFFAVFAVQREADPRRFAAMVPVEARPLGPLAVATAEKCFDAADAYYYRSMARVQRLRTVRGAAHSDLSSREVDVACGSVEHLLHILRRQRRNVAAAARVERGVSSLTNALDALEAMR